MAHKKGLGSTRNGRDSNPKYLGIKKFGGESVIAGNIIVRQREQRVIAANADIASGMPLGSALTDGVVRFEAAGKGAKVNVLSETAAAAAPKASPKVSKPTAAAVA